MCADSLKIFSLELPYIFVVTISEASGMRRGSYMAKEPQLFQSRKRRIMFRQTNQSSLSVASRVTAMHVWVGHGMVKVHWCSDMLHRRC